MSLPVEECEVALERLEEHLDGQLEAALSVRLASHLAECASCRSELELGRRIRSELAALPSFDAPADVLEQVLSQREPRRPRAAWVGLAAAAVLVLAVGLFFSRGPGTTPGLLEVAPSSTEVAQAEREARYALALVGRATGQRIAHDLKHDVFDGRVVQPMTRRLSMSLTGTSPDAFESDG